MWQLYQFPLCPFSRKVRLVLDEKGVEFELVRENPWERRDQFRKLNESYQTPVLHDEDRDLTLADSGAICEYLEETVDRAPMLWGSALQRAEIRRVVGWFDGCFYGEVTAPLLREKMRKRLHPRQPPDSGAIRNAMRRAAQYLHDVDSLIDKTPWLAGTTLTLADLSAGAQFSVADYLGGIDWSGHDQARDWYRALKSRPSFVPLLSERMDGIQPPPHYTEDFE